MSTEYYFRLMDHLQEMITAGGSVRTLYYDPVKKDFFVYGHFGNSMIPDAQPVLSISEEEIEEAMDAANGDLYDAAEILATEERFELFQEFEP